MPMRILRPLSAGVLIVLLLAGTGSAETYQIDRSHSSVGFRIRHIVSRVTGTFADFSGTVVYNPDEVDSTSVQAVIKTVSIHTNDEKRDNHLRNSDFFDAERYPEITFESREVKKDGERLMVTGDLTMHGVTRTVVLSVEVLGLGIHPGSKAPVAGFAAELTLKRSDFGINSWTDAAGVLGDDVRVTLNIEAKGTGD